MIPYFNQPALPLGPITVHAFGLLVVCAVFIGARVLQRRAADDALPAQEVTRFVNWILIGGFLGAHLFDRFVYFPAQTLADPFSILRLWDGLSSFGGFLGGTLGAMLFFRRHAGDGTGWKYADAFAYAFPSGGCSAVWDASSPSTIPGARPGSCSGRCTGTASSGTTSVSTKRSTPPASSCCSIPRAKTACPRLLSGALSSPLRSVPFRHRLPQDRRCSLPGPDTGQYGTYSRSRSAASAASATTRRRACKWSRASLTVGGLATRSPGLDRGELIFRRCQRRLAKDTESSLS